jgi:hypothetical protein
MVTYKIMCSVKARSPNGHIAILRVGAGGPPLEVATVAAMIKRGDVFVVDVPGAPSVPVHVTPDGKHITTNPDGTLCNNLRHLPDCR